MKWIARGVLFAVTMLVIAVATAPVWLALGVSMSVLAIAAFAAVLWALGYAVDWAFRVLNKF